MILGCPSCKTRFRIPDAAMSAGGRRVRCGSCGNIWHATAAEEEKPAEAEPVARPETGNAPSDNGRFSKAAEEAVSRFEPASTQTDDETPFPEDPPSPSFDEDEDEDFGAAFDDDEDSAAPAMEDDHEGDILSSIADTVERQRDDDALWENDVDIGFSDEFEDDTDRDFSDDPVKHEVAETARRLSEDSTDDTLYGAAGVPALAEEATPKAHPAIYMGWGLWVVFIIGLTAVIGLMPQRLEAWWPPIGQLYEAFVSNAEEIAAPSQTAARPEPKTPPMPDDVFRVQINGNPEWQAVGNGWTLLINGSITNESDETAAIPDLSLKLLDQNGNLLKRAPVGLAVSEITPQGRVPFEVRVDNAPAKTTGIIHDWEQRSTS